METLRDFYGRCRPPGWWGPIVREFPRAQRDAIRRETVTDLVDCALGVIFATACIVGVIAPLGRHWMLLAVTLVALAASGTAFISRWARRGVFSGLGAEQPTASPRSTMEMP
jgi:hypothetical protein